MNILTLLALSTLALAKHHESATATSDSSSLSNAIYYPRRGKFVVVKLKTRYDAYPSICRKYGFEPAHISKHSLSAAFDTVERACVGRVWIQKLGMCEGTCEMTRSIAWDDRIGGRVELWQKKGGLAYALCQKTKQQICKDNRERKVRRGEIRRRRHRRRRTSCPSSEDEQRCRRY